MPPVRSIIGLSSETRIPANQDSTGKEGSDAPDIRTNTDRR